MNSAARARSGCEGRRQKGTGAGAPQPLAEAESFRDLGPLDFTVSIMRLRYSKSAMQARRVRFRGHFRGQRFLTDGKRKERKVKAVECRGRKAVTRRALIDVSDPPAIAKALGELASDPTRRQQLAKMHGDSPRNNLRSTPWSQAIWAIPEDFDRSSFIG
jgi:hypothetical protein